MAVFQQQLNVQKNTRRLAMSQAQSPQSATGRFFFADYQEKGVEENNVVLPPAANW